MIILDIGMPNKSGVEACKEIKEYFENGNKIKHVDAKNINSLHPYFPINRRKSNSDGDMGSLNV